MEEQKVVEAKIRMQQQQRQEEEERQQRKEERSSFCRSSLTQNPSYDVSGVIEHMDVSPSQDSSSIQMLRQAQNTGLYRDDEFDVDLEDIMVMEAIWLSIQENGRAGPTSSTDAVSDPTTSGDYHVSQELTAAASSTPSSSPYGDEHRHFRRELSSTYGEHESHSDMLLPSSSRSSIRVKKNQPNQINISDEFDREDILAPQLSYGRRCSRKVKNIQRIHSIHREEESEFDHGSLIAEAGTTYASSDDSDMDIAPIAMPSPPLSTRAESDSGDFFGVLPTTSTSSI